METKEKTMNRNMKHFVYLLTLIISLVFASCTSQEAKFDANLQEATHKYSLLENANSVFMKNLSTVFLDASENTNKRMQTEEYAYKLLNDFYDEAEENGMLKAITDSKSQLQLAVSKLVNPPSSRQQCYDDLLDLVKDLYEMTNIVTRRPVDIFEFLEVMEEINDTQDLLTENEEMFITKYGQYLNK
jgi:rubrerythrin